MLYFTVQTLQIFQQSLVSVFDIPLLKWMDSSLEVVVVQIDNEKISTL